MANLNLKPFKDYLRSFVAVLQQGDAREESFYPALAQLFSNYAQESDRAGVRVTTQPKKTEAGNPDFRVWDGMEFDALLKQDYELLQCHQA